MSIAKDEQRKFDQKLRYHLDRPRQMPWRVPEADGSLDAYKILVSEIMLQQTQVARVIPKYIAFLKKFPDIQALCSASLGEVIIAWSGLGYNRRAKYLHEAAKQLSKSATWDYQHLIACQGIGPNTAKAIRVYAYNKPEVYAETNIRTVYITHFFKNEHSVSDTAIQSLVAATIDRNNPRAFYWALMDYGHELKRSARSSSQKSLHYKKQSKFIGSTRQIRGQVLHAFTQRPYSHAELRSIIDDPRLERILLQLIDEGLVTKTKGMLGLP